MQKQFSYDFKYEGDFSSLDALTVLQTQMNFISVFNEIKTRTFPEFNLVFKIKAVEDGSLELQHVIEFLAVGGMFAIENYDHIKRVFTILNDIIKLKRFLKNKKAESSKDTKNKKIEIHLKGKNILIEKDAFQIYQDSPLINTSLQNTGRLLSASTDVKSIQISEKRKQKKLLRLGRKDFAYIAESNPYLDKATSEEIYKAQILFIKKANLFPEKNKNWFWEFIHKGRDIKAKINDEIFKAKINSGLKVGQGDRIKADLKSFLKFDKRYNTFIETGRYEVSNIVEIIGRTSQTKFDF